MSRRARVTRARSAGAIRQFTPGHLPGLRLWVDAQETTSFTLAGTAISTWADLSGNNNHLAQSISGRRPTHDATGFPGDLPCAVYDGVDDALISTAASLANAMNGEDKAVTGFFVIDPIVGSSTNLTIASWGHTTNLIRLYRWYITGTLAVGILAGAHATQKLDDANSNQFLGHMLTSSAPQIVSRVDTGTTQRVWVNGELGIQSELNTGVLTVDQFALGVLRRQTAHVAWFHGKIAAAIIYARALNDVDRGKVERYLSERWRVALT